MTVNTTIVAACKKASSTIDKTVAFFNSTTSSANPMTWWSFANLCLVSAKRFPLHEKLIFYPNAFMTRNIVIYTLMFALFQMIPAIIADTILALSGKKIM